MALVQRLCISALMVAFGISTAIAETETKVDNDKVSSGGDVFASADEAARQSANPLGGDFIVWINQWNIDFQEGDITNKTRNSYTHIFQPVVPFKLPSIGKDWVMVNRPTLPIVYHAELPRGPIPGEPELQRFGSDSGLGDVTYFALVGISRKQPNEMLGEGDFVLAGGITTQWPTGTNDFTQNVYAAGPAAVLAFIGKKYMLGFLAQQWWSYSKKHGTNSGNNTKSVSKTDVQIFYYKNFEGGWQIGGTPILEFDWQAKSSDKYALPIGLGVFKTVVFGEIPVKFGVEAQHYAGHQDSFGNRWRIQFTISPITPNFFKGLF